MENTDPDVQRELDKIEARKRKADRPWYKKKRFIIPLILFFLYLVSSFTESNDPVETSSETSETQTPESDEDESPEPSETSELEVDESMVEPWPIFEPLVLSGDGDDVVLVDELPTVFALAVTGNEEDRFFAVRALDEAGERIDSLVSTTAPYEGTSIYWEDKSPSAFEVEAQGAWFIEVFPIESLPEKPKGSEISGSGDSAYRLAGLDGLVTLDITGNAEGRFFAVRAYDRDSYWDSLVSATEPYEGTVRISPSAVILEIEAVGDWILKP